MTASPPLDVLLCGRFDAAERDALWHALRAAAPLCRWHRDDAPFDRSAIDVAVVANPEPGALAHLPNLRLVQSLWAGVDKLLADATVPAQVPLARMVDPAMNAAMAETALWAVLGCTGAFSTMRRSRRVRSGSRMFSGARMMSACSSSARGRWAARWRRACPRRATTSTRGARARPRPSRRCSPRPRS